MSEKPPPRKRDTEKEFRRIRHERDKQMRKRMLATEEVVYVDTSRNISVNLGEDDLKQDMEEQGICTATDDSTGPTSSMLHKEAIYHLMKGKTKQATSCIEKAEELLDTPDYNILTTQTEIEMKKGNYLSALKISGNILVKQKNNLKAIFLRAESLFNLCDFEHALVLYNRG